MAAQLGSGPPVKSRGGLGISRLGVAVRAVLSGGVRPGDAMAVARAVAPAAFEGRAKR